MKPSQRRRRTRSTPLPTRLYAGCANSPGLTCKRRAATRSTAAGRWGATTRSAGSSASRDWSARSRGNPCPRTLWSTECTSRSTQPSACRRHRIAQAAREDATGVWQAGGNGASVEYGDGPDDWPDTSRDGTVVYNEGAPTPDQAEHIARHNPRRVLDDIRQRGRDIDTIRRILDAGTPTHEHEHTGEYIRFGGWQSCTDDCPGAVWEHIVRLLAYRFAGEPGWQPGWAPQHVPANEAINVDDVG
jgi:hypothetical protein